MAKEISMRTKMANQFLELVKYAKIIKSHGGTFMFSYDNRIYFDYDVGIKYMDINKCFKPDEPNFFDSIYASVNEIIEAGKGFRKTKSDIFKYEKIFMIKNPVKDPEGIYDFTINIAEINNESDLDKIVKEIYKDKRKILSSALSDTNDEYINFDEKVLQRLRDKKICHINSPYVEMIFSHPLFGDTKKTISISYTCIDQTDEYALIKFKQEDPTGAYIYTIISFIKLTSS